MIRPARTVVISILLLAAASVKINSATSDSKPGRLTLPLDERWRFLKADAPGAEQPDFNDASWRPVNLPHDWSIEGPFDKDAPTRGAGGFLPSGAAWYRNHFAFPAADAARRVFIEFDGVMADSDVWINGFHLGKRPYGYVSFRYELTGHLNFGEDKPNVLAVRADTSRQPASRWYTGGGIYRHVRLVVVSPVHIDQWSTFVTTPQVSAREAKVLVQSTVANQSNADRNVALRIALIAPNGRAVRTVETGPQTVTAGKSADFRQEIPVTHSTDGALPW